jgi:4'-phosphopantetheinyl transferase
MNNSEYGNIILNRQEKIFNASFCIIRANLPSLIENLSMLHPAEKEYYHRLKFDRRKQSYLLGRLAAKKAVSTLAGIKNADSFHIDFGVFEFPVVKKINQNIQASISHCDNIGIALAFPEEHPMGLDVERINVQKADVMKSQANPAETTLLEKSEIPPIIGHTLAWTAKEGLSKIIRTGLTMDFQMAEIKSIEQDGPLYTTTFRHFNQYKAISCHSGDYICSVVLPGRTNAGLDSLWAHFKTFAT